MTTTTITNFRKNVYSMVENTVRFNEPVSITTKDGNAVMISEEEYLGLIETLYLTSLPDMKEKLTVARQHLDHAEKSMRYLSPGRQLREKQQRMADLENRFHYAMRQQLDLAERQMTNYERRMTAGAQAAETRAEERQSDLRKRLPQLMQHIFEREAHRFEILASRIDGLSPVKKLAQGYAYVSNADGRNIRSVHQTAQGERLSIEVSDGRIQADVVSTEERKAGWL